MSWHFSRALVAEYSAATCSDGAPSAPWNTTPMPQAYCSPDRMTAVSRLSRFGMMFAPLTDDRGAELLTWYLAGFPVRTSARQERAPESPESAADCGGKWHGLSVRYDRATHSWKTHHCLFQEDLPQSSVTLPKWGMMRDGVCLEQLTQERRTDETDAGLLPTPLATLATHGGPNQRDSSGRPGLQQAAMMWPTATRNGWRSEGSIIQLRVMVESGKITEAEAEAMAMGSLRPARMGSWPTPTKSDAMGGPGCSGRDGGVNLRTAVKFPTPTKSDHKGSGPTMIRSDGKMRGDRLDYATERTPDGESTGGQLNPTWVELLMGWPKDWTCFNPISMVQYQQWMMGCIENEETRKRETMRMLRSGIIAQEVSRKIGRFCGIREATVLLSIVCQHSNRPDQTRLFLACAEALEGDVRGVRASVQATSTSSGPEGEEQQTGEHSNAVQALSRLLAYYGKEAWKNGSWENAIPRVTTKVAARVDRLKAIGNGQVPAVAALAWRVLTA